MLSSSTWYKHFGIYVKNFKDTFLASKLITAGLEVPKGYNGLASLVLHRFGVDLQKLLRLVLQEK
jgi:hypothetical protein